MDAPLGRARSATRSRSRRRSRRSARRRPRRPGRGDPRPGQRDARAGRVRWRDPAAALARRLGAGPFTGRWSPPRAATPTRRCRGQPSSTRWSPTGPGTCGGLDALRGRRGRLAARRGPGPQGGPRQRLGRGRLPGQTWRRRGRGTDAPRAPCRGRLPDCRGTCQPRRCVRRRRVAAGEPTRRARAHRLNLGAVSRPGTAGSATRATSHGQAAWRLIVAAASGDEGPRMEQLSSLEGA